MCQTIAYCPYLTYYKMHTREKPFSRVLSVTCCDICRLPKCPIKKTIDKAVSDNIREAWVRRGRKSKPKR
jgi:hypothetical protein